MPIACPCKIGVQMVNLSTKSLLNVVIGYGNEKFSKRKI